MINVTFLEPDGTRREVLAKIGVSLMEAARDANIEGILAECGGACACATCHVVVEGGPVDALPLPEDQESMVLEGALDVSSNSRLSCQVQATQSLDGLILRIPASQF